MKTKTLMRYLFNPSKKITLLVAISVGFFLIFNTFLIVITGGVPNAFAHTMYIPVLLTAIFFGVFYTAIVAILGGMLIGPLMMLGSLNVSTEPFAFSAYRTAYFLGIGLIFSMLFHYIRSQYRVLHNLHTHDAITGIPNGNYYLENYTPSKTKSVFITLQINNYESLKLMLGNQDYYDVLYKLYLNIKEIVNGTAIIVLADERRFWIEIDEKDFEPIKDILIHNLDLQTIVHHRVPLFVDLALGVSLSSETIDNSERFKESDLAAVHAKTHGLKHVVYRQEYASNQDHFIRLGKLPEALKNNELFIEYQPIIDLKTNQCISFEALIRWRYQNSVLMPAEFIPTAENTRIISDITAWVIKQIIADYKTFEKVDSNLIITMNVSQRNLYDIALIQNMLKMMKEANFSQKALEIEITESTLMLNRKAAQYFIEQFKAQGASTVLDDFGTGYSSLSMLRDLPVDKVKVDRLFTLNILKNKDAFTLVKSMIDLAHNLNLTVIAEGIETEGILSVLNELGCDFGQGYLFAKPMPLGQAVKWFSENNS